MTFYHIGCSGYFYLHWKRKFYPKDLQPSSFFDYYQRKFDTVEINSTFYTFPKPTSIQRLYKLSKKDFLISVKMNREITHIKRFVGVDKYLETFYDTISLLNKKLGCILIQLPPSIKYSDDFLYLLVGSLEPYREYRNAIEFRHPSWWKENVYSFFEERGLIFVSVDSKNLPTDIIKTSAIGYVRFHGREERYKSKYTDAYLQNVRWKIEEKEFKEVYVYFNNDFNAYAPQNALTLKKYVVSSA